MSFSSAEIPVSSTMLYAGIIAIAAILTILGACFGFYRLSAKHLLLAEQRLNFVSSVSHELKTPLTSIRMYSEMLKDGTFLSNESRKDYYQFIFAESERLTRLINNVLQLSKLNQPKQELSPSYSKLTILQDIIRSKVSSIMDKHDFQLNIISEVRDLENCLVFVDQDAFSQVIINITDNAIKFFNDELIRDPNRKKVDFIFRQKPQDNKQLEVEIRDYGLGINAGQENKIFDLFYRSGSELTRITQGTGIGLALVKDLISGQHGEIQAQRREPGLAFVITFPCKID